ncbi:MAG: TonB-dependent receptor, partial [Alistipes sp.]|nr:TonB-dependent receptor [Alistipes sp.]
GWLDNLKVRASWGQLGNMSVGDYATQLIYTRRSNVFGDTAVSGAGITAIVNEGLKWETTTMTNVGVDLSLFRTRFNLSVDLFHKLTEDILVRTKIPGVFGGMDAPFRNAGQVRNRGIEIEAGWHDKIGKFEYAVSANYSYVRNKVLKYQGNVPAYSGQRILLEGYCIWDYYVREVEGIATQEKIDEMLADGYVFYPSTPHPGDFIYKDRQQQGEEGYKVINDGDRVIKGSSYPKHFFGFTLSANWKGIDFSALFSGVAGVSQYLNGTWYTNVLKNGSVINKKFLGAWSYDNPTSRIPAITTDDGGRNTVANDFWLQDASYLKLRNLTVGYTLPQKWFSPLISRCRVYFSGENLLTFTKFEGLDPETGSTSNYPNMKRYMFGVSITF